MPGYGEVSVAGTQAIVPKESCSKFFPLPLVRSYEKDVCAVASWDSSIHDNQYLNRLTPSEWPRQGGWGTGSRGISDGVDVSHHVCHS